MILQQDEDKRKYDAELASLILEKDQMLADRNQQFQRLKKQKQQLEISSQSGYVQTQGRNEKMLEDIEALYQKKLAI